MEKWPTFVNANFLAHQDAALGFGEAEIRPSEEDGASASPEEAFIGVPIPCFGVGCGASRR
jgi:hypothetical protein